MTEQEKNVARQQLIDAISAVVENQDDANYTCEDDDYDDIDMEFVIRRMNFYLSDDECDWFVHSYFCDQDVNVTHLREVFPTLTWEEIREELCR